MGLKVSPAEVAQLVGRTERTIRQWIASGKLHAEPSGSRARRPGVGPYRWLIDIEELKHVPGVTINQARLAELEAQAALEGAGASILERLARVEQDVAALQREVAQLRASQSHPSPSAPHDG